MIVFEDLVKETLALAEKKGFHFTWKEAPRWLMYLVTEVAEAMEAWRDNDKEHFEEELVDILIRTAHLVGDLDYTSTIEKALRKKQSKNWNRKPGHGRVNV